MFLGEWVGQGEKSPTPSLKGEWKKVLSTISVHLAKFSKTNICISDRFPLQSTGEHKQNTKKANASFRGSPTHNSCVQVGQTQSATV